MRSKSIVVVGVSTVLVPFETHSEFFCAYLSDQRGCYTLARKSKEETYPDGNIDSTVINQLLEGRRFQIRALARMTSNDDPPTLSPNIRTFAVDFEDLFSVIIALQSQDGLMCNVLGPATKFALQKLLIDGTISAGMKLFFAREFVFNLEEKASGGEIAYKALKDSSFFDLCSLSRSCCVGSNLFPTLVTLSHNLSQVSP